MDGVNDENGHFSLGRRSHRTGRVPDRPPQQAAEHRRLIASVQGIAVYNGTTMTGVIYGTRPAAKKSSIIRGVSIASGAPRYSGTNFRKEGRVDKLSTTASTMRQWPHERLNTVRHLESGVSSHANLFSRAMIGSFYSQRRVPLS